MKKSVLFLFALLLTIMLGWQAIGENQLNSLYEYAYKRTNSEYAIYYLFDIDGKIARNFATNDYGVLVGKLSGSIEDELIINYMEGWDEKFYIDKTVENKAVLVDAYGYKWEFEKTSIEEAEAILMQEDYYDMSL